ncbi:MAG: PD40 domain-containing protein [Gemmatimonadetes bacterium]|nr:PD40 domain-containing protein [Gemmatimonadota bacterium]
MDSLDHARPFAAEPYDEGLPRVSPDGRYVAYYSARTGNNEVYVRQLPQGGEEVRISQGGGIDPAWGPSGRELFHRSADSLMVADLDVSARLTVQGRRGLFALPPNALIATSSGSYDVLPDGRGFVLFERASVTAEQRSPVLVRVGSARELAEKVTAAP